MKKELINPVSLVKPLSKYSHGTKITLSDCAIIFTTGQIAVDKSGKVIAPGDAKKQSEFVFEEIKAILENAGASMKDIVKATIFVTDMKYFPHVAEVRNKYLDEEPPASTFVEVKSLIKDGCVVEVEAIAIAPKTDNRHA